MAYKVNLTLENGLRTQRTEIKYEPTPKVGDTIDVDLVDDGSAIALVTAVRERPPQSPGNAVEGMDEVDAQEW